MFKKIIFLFLNHQILFTFWKTLIFRFQLTQEEMAEINNLEQQKPRDKKNNGKKQEIPPVKIIDFTD